MRNTARITAAGFLALTITVMAAILYYSYTQSLIIARSEIGGFCEYTNCTVMVKAITKCLWCQVAWANVTLCQVNNLYIPVGCTGGSEGTLPPPPAAEPCNLNTKTCAINLADRVNPNTYYGMAMAASGLAGLACGYFTMMLIYYREGT